MKAQKLLGIAAIVCLLVGASGAAMARNDCPDGSIIGGVYDEIVITEFVECVVLGVLVNERVIVKDADDFTMTNSIVNGNLRVINTVGTALVNNQVFGNLVTKGGSFSIVLRNIVNGGSIRVNDDSCEQFQEVKVEENLVYTGNLRVNCNKKADVRNNSVRGGNITCRDNALLDSRDNDSVGGTTNCSRSLFQ
jgi:hypothetical protein